jgi:RNA polymerase sigma-70 factor, ECF subfamily
LAESNESGTGRVSGAGSETESVDELFDDWVVETMPGALAYCSSLVRDRNLAEDLVHDCYLRIFQKRSKYDLRRDGWAILRRSITNACINWTRRRRPTHSLDSTAHESQTAGSRLAQSLPDRAAIEPLDQAIAQELSELVNDGLGMLSVLQRAALELRCLGHSTSEIASILGSNANHVRVMIHRARETMAAFLSEHWNPS